MDLFQILSCQKSLISHFFHKCSSLSLDKIVIFCHPYYISTKKACLLQCLHPIMLNIIMHPFIHPYERTTEKYTFHSTTFPCNFTSLEYNCRQLPVPSYSSYLCWISCTLVHAHTHPLTYSNSTSYVLLQLINFWCVSPTKQKKKDTKKQRNQKVYSAKMSCKQKKTVQKDALELLTGEKEKDFRERLPHFLLEQTVGLCCYSSLFSP